MDHANDSDQKVKWKDCRKCLRRRGSVLDRRRQDTLADDRRGGPVDKQDPWLPSRTTGEGGLLHLVDSLGRYGRRGRVLAYLGLLLVVLVVLVAAVSLLG